jgi:hypothetical protein
MTEIVVAQRMWQRRGTAAEWSAANPIMAAGEIGVQLNGTSPATYKIGDGVTAWTSLAFQSGSPTYVHAQGAAATTWTVNHNLGFNPSVSLRTTGGVEFDAQVVHTSVNQTVITLKTALAGTARFN